MPNDLGHLVCEGGFPDVGSLTSFALALGIFHDMKGEFRDNIPAPETLSSYSLAALIISEGGTRDMDVEEMRKEMIGMISGGYDMMSDICRGRSVQSALKKIAKLIPLR
jgi:hypothetical protein